MIFSPAHSNPKLGGGEEKTGFLSGMRGNHSPWVPFPSYLLLNFETREEVYNTFSNIVLYLSHNIILTSCYN